MDIYKIRSKKNKKGLFFDFLIKNIVVFSVIFILIFKIFMMYSPLSSDKKYQDFYIQIKYILDLSNDFKLGLKDYNSFVNNLSYQEFLIKNTNLNTIFKQYYIKKQKIIFINSYNTPCYFENKNFIIETINEKNYIPLKVMIDIDNSLDDGIPATGRIKSNINNYSIGCQIIVNL
ncbi:MAG: hypothetical protein ACP5RD_04425 [bacterium]